MSDTSLWKQFEGCSIENTYFLRELIGVGGFGGVFHSDHVIEGAFIRSVAIKLIVPDPSTITRQLSELTAATTLRHDHLLGCFHAGSTTMLGSRLLYLVMQVAEESLAQRLGRMPLSAQETLLLGEQLASALAYLHAQRRIHRDVKPANVLRAEGRWQLSDFGTIRTSTAGSTSHTGILAGTLTYMPPESFDGVVSPAWDMWSFGVLLMRALTGRQPFPSVPETQFLRAIIEQEPEIPPGMPMPFEDIIRGCLRKDYRSRYTAESVIGKLGDHRRAEDQRAAVRKAERVASLKNQAAARREAGRWEEALAALAEAQNLEPADAELGRLIAGVEAARAEGERVQQELAEAVAAKDYDRAAQLLRAANNRGGSATEDSMVRRAKVNYGRQVKWAIAAVAFTLIGVLAAVPWRGLISRHATGPYSPAAAARKQVDSTIATLHQTPKEEASPRSKDEDKAAAKEEKKKEDQPDTPPQSEYRLTKTFPVTRAGGRIEASLSFDGRFLALGYHGDDLKQFWIDVWDCVTGNLVRSIHADGYLWGLQMSPSGSLVAASQSVTNSEGVMLYQLDGKTSRKISDAPYADFAFSAGKKLIAIGEEKSVAIYNYESNELVRRVAIDNVGPVALSATGKWLGIIKRTSTFANDKELNVAEVMRESASIPLMKKLRFDPFQDRFAFSPDENRLLIIHDKQVTSWSVPSGRSTTFKFPGAFPAGFAGIGFYGDASLVYATDGRTVEVWEVETTKRLWRVVRQDGDTMTAMSGDCRILARPSGQKVRIYTRR
jgi:hypothetical protein